MDKYATGNLLYKLRTEHNYTQSELADILGVSNKAVSKWETGASKPKIETIYRLATLYKITVDELLSGDISNLEHTELQTIEPDFSKFESMTSEQKEEAFQKYEARQNKSYTIGCIFARIFSVYYIINIIIYAIITLSSLHFRTFKFLILASKILIIIFFLKGKFWAKILTTILCGFGFFLDLLTFLGAFPYFFISSTNQSINFTLRIIMAIIILLEFLMFLILVKSKSLRTYLEYQDS